MDEWMISQATVVYFRGVQMWVKTPYTPSLVFGNSPKMTCLPNAPKLFDSSLEFSEWNIDHMKVVLIWWFCLQDLLTESYVGTTQACRWAVQWRANRGEGCNSEKRMRCHAWWCGLTEENCLYFEDDVIFGSWVLLWIWYQIYSKFVHSFLLRMCTQDLTQVGVLYVCGCFLCALSSL